LEDKLVSTNSYFSYMMGSEGQKESERKDGRGEKLMETGDKYIFIASSCSFFGMISSMCGARRGYVCTSWVRIARWTEDLTFDFEPGEMLVLLAEICKDIQRYCTLF
jgi:hypothetical protein